MKSRRIWWIVGGAVALLLVVGGVVAYNVQQAQRDAANLKTGDVVQITAVSTVESSGSVAALQSGSVFWQTNGRVAEVYASIGDSVKAGDLLMALDPSSVPQNVIAAQADLISARKTLDELINPGAQSIANAQKALADAQDALAKAQKDLRSAQNPAGDALYDAVADAQLALETAKNNLQLSRVGTEASAVTTAENNKNTAYSALQRAQVNYDDCLKITCAELAQRESALTAAKNNYQTALDAYLTALLRMDTSVMTQNNSVDKAQERYDDAVANLNAALAGPDALKLAKAEANMAVAEANLAEAERKLNALLSGGDPNDVAIATARLQAAQATVDSMVIKAPFDGEVLMVGYQPGDAVSQATAAVVLANRSQLHVDVSVDETEVGEISVGDPVLITFNSLPDVTLNGFVAELSRFGTTVQGLVKYTVRVTFEQADPRVLLGMTADVSILTDSNDGALAVPLDAVQLDEAGEFVNRVKADGSLKRVSVVSGAVQGDLVVVTSDGLTVGDVVQLIDPRPTNSGSPFGG